MRFFKIIFCAAFIFICQETNAQKQFSVTIQFPLNINEKQVKFFYDDGQNDHNEIKADIINGQQNLYKPFYSKYATIAVMYKDKSVRFWVSDKAATINFTASDSTSNPLQSFKLTNAYAVTQDIDDKRINEYISAETKSLEDFVANNKQWFKKDSLVMIYVEKSKNVSSKKIDFVRKNAKSYYSIWLFRRELVFADYNIDSLIHIYNSSFSDSLKNSFEGSEISKRLTGRNIKKNVMAVDFAAKDMTGKMISLKDYRNKHVLLTFWASWCVPCVEEFPAIKTFRELYPTDKLEIIFVTLDADSLKFSNAVKKYDLNWVHIFNDIEVLKKYGVLAIPQVYLIDNAGKIVYSREEEKDRELALLTKILAEKFSNR